MSTVDYETPKGLKQHRWVLNLTKLCGSETILRVSLGSWSRCPGAECGHWQPLHQISLFFLERNFYGEEEIRGLPSRPVSCQTAAGFTKLRGSTCRNSCQQGRQLQFLLTFATCFTEVDLIECGDHNKLNTLLSQAPNQDTEYYLTASPFPLPVTLSG